MADEQLERITLLIQARDRDLTRTLDRMGRKIDTFARRGEQDTRRMQRTIESNFSRMGTSALAFGRSFAAGLAGGLVVGAVSSLTTNLRQVNREIASVGDRATQAGMDLAAFQEWEFVGRQFRIGTDAMVDGIKELNLRVDEFATTGGGPAAEALTRIGYNAQTAARDLQDPSRMLLEIADRLDGIDVAARIRIADELFGGTAGERFVQLLGQGSNGLRDMRARAHEVGAVLDEEMIARAEDIDRRFNEIASLFENRLRRAVVGWGLIVEDVIDAFTTDEAEASAEAMAYRLNDLAGEAQSLQAVFEMLRQSAMSIGDSAAVEAIDAIVYSLDAATGAFNDGAIQGESYRAVLAAIANDADDTLDALESIDGLDLSNAETVIDGLRALLGTLRAEAVSAAQAMSGLGMTEGTPFLPGPDGLFMPPTQQAPTRSPRPRRAPSMLGEPGTGGGGGGSQDGYLVSVEDIRERTTALEMEAAALVAVAASGREYGDAVEFARVRAQLMNDALREGREITPELQAEIDALAEAYVTAGQNVEDATARLEEMRAQSERGIDAMTDLFMGIAQGGDAARQAVSRLISEIARMAAQRGFRALAGGGGGGGFLGFLGGLLGGKRATGGPVQAGVPYLVNENTPNSEIFVPSRSGAVLNVPQAQQAMRGGGGVAEVVVRVDDDGKLRAFVERTSGNVMARARPAIVQESVRATYAANGEVPLR